MKEKILSVNNLTVILKKDNSIILKDVCFDLFSGDVLAIDGLNGSGKSTLLKIIYCQTADFIIESGAIYYYPFSNKNVLDFSEKVVLAYRSSIGFVPQKDNYDGINKVTIEDLIDDAISENGIKKNKIVECFNTYFKDNSRIKLNSIPGKLSGGEQRMVSIFLGLMCKSKSRLMIIDEPLNNLDFENATQISDLINKIRLENGNSAIMIVTHCKIITCINRQRRLAAGTMEPEDSNYECHYCMGEPNCNLFYKKEN